MNDYSIKTKTNIKNSSNKTNSGNYPTAYIIWLVVAIIIFIPTLVIARKHQLSGFQLHIFRDLNNLPNAFKYPALILTEGLGAGYPIAICVVIAALYKRYKLAWRYFVAAGTTGVVMLIAKHIAKEPRPAALLHNHLHIRAVETGLTSYPSGHAAIATSLALTTWLILPKKWRWISVLWILVVAVSRIYVGDHTPDDIAGGFAIALGVICAIRLLPYRFAKKLHLESDHTLTEKGF
jgi:membrane-associated phospholipid phosphatase